MIYNNKKRLDLIKENIPDELKIIPQWGYYHVFFNREKGKKEKVIFSAEPGFKYLNMNNEESFSTFENALDKAYKTNASGLSIILFKDNNLTCVDLDHQYDEEKKEWSVLAENLISLAGETFIEKSHSRQGLHIFTKGIFTDKTYKKKNDELGIEVYSDKKIISITGDHLLSKNMQILEPSEEYKTAVKEYVGRYGSSERQKQISYFNLGEKEVIEAIDKSQKCKDFYELFYQGLNNFESQSQADFALLNILAFFSKGNVFLMEEMFKKSALYRESKGRNYVRISCENVVKRMNKFYGDDSEELRRIKQEQIRRKYGQKE